MELRLTPKRKEPGPDDEQPRDAGPLAPGFHRVLRFGDHLLVPALINKGPSSLYLIDSGAALNPIDTETGRLAADISKPATAGVFGVQGAVKKISSANQVRLVFAGFRHMNPVLNAIDLTRFGDTLSAGIGGVLGLPVLRLLRTTIDYEDGAIRFEPAN